MTEARRALATVHRAVEGARRDADPTRITDAKLQAQQTYRGAIAGSHDTLVERRATVEWMATIDRINRESQARRPAAGTCRVRLQRLTAEVTRTERMADAARIALESALAACAEARAGGGRGRRRRRSPALPRFAVARIDEWRDAGSDAPVATAKESALTGRSSKA